MERAWHVTTQDDAGPPDIRVRYGNGRNQRHGIGMERMGKKGLFWSKFHHLPQVHDENPVRNLPDDGKVVRDEKVRERVLSFELLKELEDLRPYGYIERRKSLIGNHQARTKGNSPGDADALPLPTRKFMRKATNIVSGKTHPFKEHFHLFPHGIPGNNTVHPESFLEDGLDGHAGVKRTKRVLKNHLHILANWPQLCRRKPGNILSSKKDSPFRRLKEPEDSHPESALSAP